VEDKLAFAIFKLCIWRYVWCLPYQSTSHCYTYYDVELRCSVWCNQVWSRSWNPWTSTEDFGSKEDL